MLEHEAQVRAVQLTQCVCACVCVCVCGLFGRRCSVQTPLWHMRSLKWRREHSRGSHCVCSLFFMLRLPTNPQCHRSDHRPSEKHQPRSDRWHHFSRPPLGRSSKPQSKVGFLCTVAMATAGSLQLRGKKSDKFLTGEEESKTLFTTVEGGENMAGNLVRIKARCQLCCNFTLLCNSWTVPLGTRTFH